jgi:hypothetical protein
VNLDDELRAVLRRVEPPAGFAARVTARAQRRRAYRFAAWAAAAAMLMAAGLQYQRQRDGERAKEQAMVALRIAAREIQSVQAKMERIHRIGERR